MGSDAPPVRGIVTINARSVRKYVDRTPAGTSDQE
jgi:hypothetical protein